MISNQEEGSGWVMHEGDCVDITRDEQAYLAYVTANAPEGWMTANRVMYQLDGV